jgi:hypothetical protein
VAPPESMAAGGRSGGALGGRVDGSREIQQIDQEGRGDG